MSVTCITPKTKDGVLTVPKPKNFDISQIFDCGQCFRFNRSQDGGSYEGVAFSKYLKIGDDGENLLLYGVSESDFESVWRGFLDYDRDYESIIESFSDDETLYNAAKYSKGIRILKQDGWEALCSFIVSQNNNIPRIKAIIENMSRAFGEPFTCFDGSTKYAFPTPESLVNAGQAEIFALKTGFRAKYIYDAAKKVCSGEIDLKKVEKMTFEEAAALLETIKGVGPKVAACTLLFGFAKYSAFPKDVWVKRILANYYADGESRHFSEQYAGIAQQYLFYYERCKNNIFI